MVNDSRIDIYDYLYNLFYDVVTKNVYSMQEPQELTKSDTEDGFIVISVGDLNDASEFKGDAFGWVRCYVEAFVPPITRGRLDYEKYKVFEDSINTVINLATEDNGGTYYIQEDSVLSMDAEETSNANNIYFAFIKSFIVVIDEQKPIEVGDLYIGIGDESISTLDDVQSLFNVQHYETSNPLGRYEITLDDIGYLWICSTKPIRGVTSNGFEVPIDPPTTIGALNCYRSSNSIIASKMSFTII